MKILLAMNQPYYPALGGANKANRCLLEALAERGHEVRAVVPLLDTPVRLSRDEVIRELEGQGRRVRLVDGVHEFTLNGVAVYASLEASRLRSSLVEQLKNFDPDWALISSENPSQNLLDAALKVARSKVVFVVQAATYLPFGPQSFYPSESRKRLVESAPVIVAISQYLADYIRDWSGVEAQVVRIPVYGKGPFPDFARFDGGYVTLVNPCGLKGISIFLALARAMPEVEFAAVPTWGTTSEDLSDLRALPNVKLLEPSLNFDDILSQTRVLLMPSLVHEGFGFTTVEATLRGIPTLASDLGGLREAKLGVDFMLPVGPIETYRRDLDGNGLPVPVIPEQPIDPWLSALRRLLGDRELYGRISSASRDAAQKFVSTLDIGSWERLLMRLTEERKAGEKDSWRPAQDRSGAGPDQHSPDQGSEEGVAALTPEQRALLMLRLRKNGSRPSGLAGLAGPAGPAGPAGEPHFRQPIRQAPRDEELPLSFAQQRLWFLSQLDPQNPVYNQPVAIRLVGRLDKAALERALGEIIRRHEALRANFQSVAGRPVQVIRPAGEFTLPVIDLRGMPEDEREEAARRLLAEESVRVFDLARDPLIRAGLIRVKDDEHVALFTLHHIISDGWSVGVLVRELSALYEASLKGEALRLDELPIQYADFAYWQREFLRGEALDSKLAYWKKRLDGLRPTLELPFDRPRPAAQSFRGAQYMFLLSERLTADLKTLSNREHVTPFMTLLAAFSLLLHRYTGEADIAVGTPVAGRNRLELERLIGFFINTLVLRTDVSGDPTFRDLLARVREATLGAYANQDVPFEKIVEALQPDRSLSHMPLFQTLLAFNNVPESPLELPGLRLEPVRASLEASKFDLALYMDERGSQLFGCLQYSADLFEAPTIIRMAGQFQTLLENIVADPGRRLSGLTLAQERDRARLISDFNDDLQD